MADKEIKVKITTEADAGAVEDLKAKLEEIINTKINIDAEIDSSTDELQGKIEELNGETVEVNIDTEDGEITNAYAIVTDLDGYTTKINIDTDTANINEISEQLSNLSDKDVNVGVNVNTDNLLSITDEIQTLQNNSEINLEIQTDDTGLQTIQEALNEATNQVDELEQALSSIEMGNIEGDFDAISLQLEEAQQRAEELSNALSSIDSSNINDASLSTQDLANNSDQARQNVDDLSNSMGLIESTMLMDMANQLGAIGDKAEGMAQGMDTTAISVGQLATQTGIAEGEMKNLIANISNVTFPQSEAMMYVKSLDQIGVSNENLGRSATNLDKINDAFGLGAGTVNSLGQELSVLGVDMNNVESSFNALAYANANTVGGMENYYSFLKKYDAQFSEMGFNVDQASVIIAGATHKFGGGRAALSGLSDALKNCNGDTRALEEALDLEAGSLDNASQLTGEYEGQLQDLANEEMEHKTLTERMGAVWEDITLQLEPLLSPMAQLLGLIGSFGQFALGINSIITLAQTFGLLNTETLALIPSQIAEGIAGMISIGWILLAVAVILILIGILVYLYFNNEQVRQTIDGIIQAFSEFVGYVTSAVLGTIQWLISEFQNFTSSLGLNSQDWIQSILAFILFIPQLPIKLGIALINGLAHLLGFKGNFISYLTNAGSNAVSNFMSYIGSLPGRLSSELQGMLSTVGQWASTLPQKFWQAGVDAVKNFLSALGIASPGTMQRMLVWEITEMGNRVPEESKTLLGNMDKLGSNIVDEFGNPVLSYGFEAVNGEMLASANNNTPDNIAGGDIIINVGSVDNDERVNEIVDAVKKALSWDNRTAGRTI